MRSNHRQTARGKDIHGTSSNVRYLDIHHFRLVDGPKEHLIAYRFFDQPRFASKRALVKCSITSRDDDTIRRRRSAVLNADDVADFENVLVLALDVRALLTEDGFYSDGISRDE